MSKLLTGEDGEHAVLSRFHLNDEELEKYKSEILNNKMLVVAERDDSSHKEVDEHNSAYENIDITHMLMNQRSKIISVLCVVHMYEYSNKAGVRFRL